MEIERADYTGANGKIIIGYRITDKRALKDYLGETALGLFEAVEMAREIAIDEGFAYAPKWASTADIIRILNETDNNRDESYKAHYVALSLLRPYQREGYLEYTRKGVNIGLWKLTPLAKEVIQTVDELNKAERKAMGVKAKRQLDKATKT